MCCVLELLSSVGSPGAAARRNTTSRADKTDAEQRGRLAPLPQPGLNVRGRGHCTAAARPSSSCHTGRPSVLTTETHGPPLQTWLPLLPFPCKALLS